MNCTRFSWALGGLLGALGLGLISAAGQELPRRGFLGTRLTPVEQPVAGGRVGRIAPDSPAAKLGLQTGDVITHINGRAVDTPVFASQFARRPPAGEGLQFTVARGGTVQQLQTTLPEYPREAYANAEVIYSHMTDAKGQRLRLTIT
jgi:S1-C subfamily serine protease